MKEKLKPFIPHLIAGVIFYAMTALFFMPLYQGKRVFQGDIVNFLGASKEVKDFKEAGNPDPLWTNSMFGGMPTYQVGVDYSGNLFTKVIYGLIPLVPYPATGIFLCMLSFYILLNVLQKNQWISVIGAIAFAFSSYFIIIIEAGHNSKLMTISYMPLVLASVIYTYRTNCWTGAVFTALSFALNIVAGHPQMTYYLGIIILFYVIAEAIRHIQEKQIPSFMKASVLLLFAVVLGASTHFSNIYCTYEYTKQTIRGKSELTTQKTENQTTGLDKDYATAWSYGISESLTLLIPNYKGGGSAQIGENKAALKAVPSQFKQGVSSMDAYFGEQPFTSGPVYVGAIICFLFVLSFFVLDGWLKWSMVAAFVLSLMLAWGKHFMSLTDLFLDYVPLYNKFRAVASILVNVELIMPLLAMLALSKVLSNDQERQKYWKPILYSFAITAGFCLITFVLPDVFSSVEKTDELEKTVQQYVQYGAGKEEEVRPYLAQLLPYVEEARKAMVSADALRSFFFILLAFIGLVLWTKKTIQTQVLLGLIGTFTLVDLWSVNKRYLQDENYVAKKKMEFPIEKTAVDEQILRDPSLYYRVYNTTIRPDQDSKTSYFHKSLGGYSAAKLRRYQDLIDYHFNRGNRSVFNMLNAKYYIFKDQQGNIAAQQNPEALGNAWFVSEYRLVQNPDSEITALYNFNPRTTAIVDQVYKPMVESFVADTTDSLSYIKLTAYAPNQLTYDYQASSTRFTVFSEIYFKDGWNAYIDGVKTPHFRVNYVLRAMMIPSGKHTIEFKFEPDGYYLGEKISLATSSLLIILFLGVLFWEIKKRMNSSEIKSN